MLIRNYIERLWQALHDTVIRNHPCCSMWQLLKKFTILWKPSVHFRESQGSSAEFLVM